MPFFSRQKVESIFILTLLAACFCWGAAGESRGRRGLLQGQYSSDSAHDASSGRIRPTAPDKTAPPADQEISDLTKHLAGKATEQKNVTTALEGMEKADFAKLKKRCAAELEKCLTDLELSGDIPAQLAALAKDDSELLETLSDFRKEPNQVLTPKMAADIKELENRVGKFPKIKEISKATRLDQTSLFTKLSAIKSLTKEKNLDAAHHIAAELVTGVAGDERAALKLAIEKIENYKKDDALHNLHAALEVSDHVSTDKKGLPQHELLKTQGTRAAAIKTRQAENMRATAFQTLLGKVKDRYNSNCFQIRQPHRRCPHLQSGRHYDSGFR